MKIVTPSPGSMSPEKIFILANAASRTLNRPALQAAASHLGRFVPCEILFTDSIANACTTAATLSADPKNLVVACGGDGTIHTIANNLARDAAMGIIPSGTANVIARELGIPASAREAAKLLLTGAVQKIDLGLCNRRKFIFVAGIGFDAEVAASVSPRLKKYFGRYAYHLTAIRRFADYRPPLLRVSVDGADNEFVGRFAIIANMRRYGGDLFFAPAARYNDGVLDMVLVENFDMQTILRLLNFAKGKGRFPAEGVRILKGKNFVVRADRPVPFELDGEVLQATTDFSIGMAPESARFITP